MIKSVENVHETVERFLADRQYVDELADELTHSPNELNQALAEREFQVEPRLYAGVWAAKERRAGLGLEESVSAWGWTRVARRVLVKKHINDDGERTSYLLDEATAAVAEGKPLTVDLQLVASALSPFRERHRLYDPSWLVHRREKSMMLRRRLPITDLALFEFLPSAHQRMKMARAVMNYVGVNHGMDALHEEASVSSLEPLVIAEADLVERLGLLEELDDAVEDSIRDAQFRRFLRLVKRLGGSAYHNLPREVHQRSLKIEEFLHDHKEYQKGAKRGGAISALERRVQPGWASYREDGPHERRVTWEQIGQWDREYTNMLSVPSSATEARIARALEAHDPETAALAWTALNQRLIMAQSKDEFRFVLENRRAVSELIEPFCMERIGLVHPRGPLWMLQFALDSMRRKDRWFANVLTDNYGSTEQDQAVITNQVQAWVMKGLRLSRAYGAFTPENLLCAEYLFAQRMSKSRDGLPYTQWRMASLVPLARTARLPMQVQVAYGSLVPQKLLVPGRHRLRLRGEKVALQSMRLAGRTLRAITSKEEPPKDLPQ